MRVLRKASQVLFILFFFILFLCAVFPLETKIPVDLFLRMDPLTGLSVALASRHIVKKILVSLVLLFLTVIFGRFFCGWICPMGSTLDGTDHLLVTKSSRRGNRRGKSGPGGLRYLKYALLTACLVAAVFSVQFTGLFDPIPLYTRTVTSVLYPVFVLLTEGIIGFFMSVGYFKNAIFSFHELLRGSLLPVSPVFFRGSVLIGAFFLAIVLAGFVQKRFWCRNLCPLGGLLGLFSAFRPYRRMVSKDCTSCRRCLKQCRMGAIHDDFYGTDHAECINCMDCRAVCGADAVRFGFSLKPEPAVVDFSRRQMLGAGVAGLAALGLTRTGFIHWTGRGKVVRPPGALEENRFLDRCVRCGECIRICSTSGKGLQHTGLESGWEGLGTPLLHPPEGYCEYNCNLCGKGCPTGAIPSLSMAEKQGMKMGTAHFDKTRCIPWYYGENCMVCEEHCPVPEKAIRFRKETVTTIDGRRAEVLLPYVDESSCVGCGICVKCCPLEADKGIFLTNAGEMRT
jgi:polyferredoxin/Pyruvate/2-oxoacid:ferredoxin oxidoreductase delta subunit